MLNFLLIEYQKLDHVGMVVRFSRNDVRVFDSNCDTGVTLDHWDNFIEENDLYMKYILIID